MIDFGKRNLLGVLVDAVDEDAAVRRILRAARTGSRCTCTALAVHGVMTGVRDEEHRYRLNRLDLVVPDGQPVRWGLNLLHRLSLPERVYGPRLMLEVCRRAAREGLPVFFYGSRREVVESLVVRLETRIPGLRTAGAEPSRFRSLDPEERDECVERILSSGARITFVGLGCPRQEVWVYELGDLLGMPVIAVGAAFEFHAGTLRQAPEALQRRGLEWLYRLAREPGRLWRRYLLLNPAYVYFLALQLSGLRHFPPETSVAPTEEMLLG